VEDTVELLYVQDLVFGDCVLEGVAGAPDGSLAAAISERAPFLREVPLGALHPRCSSHLFPLVGGGAA
jgi:hypothetical protein